MATSSEANRQARIEAFEAGAKKHQRTADKAEVLALRNMEEEYELRLDNHYDGEGTMIGEGGQIRVKKGWYLCRTSSGEYYTVDEATFAKTHQIFVEAVKE